jgi:hypothetical protein
MTREGDVIRVTIPPGDTGRHRRAREIALSWLKPGEELEETAASWPVYMYQVRRVAFQVMLTPEERTLLDDAVRSHLRYLTEGLRTASNESRLLLMQEIAKVEKLHPKLREVP